MSSHRVMQPPGGDCHDMFGTDFGSTAPVSQNPHHRITKPPGGESSDIFSPVNTPPGTPRRVKNYMASTIFSPEESQGAQRRPRREDDSFNRLFGANNNGVATNGNSRGDSPDSSGTSTPRSVKNYQKSNIIFSDAEVSRKLNGHAANGHNGINGHVITNGLNGHSNGHSDGSISGSSSGSATPNGTNGHTNGHTNGVMASPRRIPPGGFSSKLW